MSPIEKYRADLVAGIIYPDPQQEVVVHHLQALYQALQEQSTGPLSMGQFLFAWMSRPNDDPVKGIYLWGGVGRGKTYLMDLFFECLPFERKKRTHFHRFMQSVHSKLTALQGQKNPLAALAESIAQEARVLCFDEFFVIDIGDAMILAGLLEELFKRDVVLVATSNIYPDGLYQNGLQRKRFLPAIKLINTRTTVVELKSDTDYRLRSLSQANLYLCPNDEAAELELARKFLELTRDPGLEPGPTLIVLARKLQTRHISGDVVWFEFSELCGGPRSAFDYVEIAKLFHTVILSNIPQMSDDTNDSARRFVSLIDELYDRRVKLLVSAQGSISNLYTGNGLAFAFERTESRLLEMQSHEYLCSPHQA
ncbi:MAG: cell division protein ZapE [Pseudohongiellaceae bacterium]|jgi:cell division protein ZapE